jgi:hypothetical protein
MPMGELPPDPEVAPVLDPPPDPPPDPLLDVAPAEEVACDDVEVPEEEPPEVLALPLPQAAASSRRVGNTAFLIIVLER